MIVAYIDFLIMCDYLIKMWSILYYFFFKYISLFFCLLTLLLNFNWAFYLVGVLIVEPALSLHNFLAIEFTSIQLLHIILKFFKFYLLIYSLLTILRLYLKTRTSLNLLVSLFFYVLVLYILTGSFWSWLEPSWASWWFGEDIEELIILSIFLICTTRLHFTKYNHFVCSLLVLSFLLFSLSYINILFVLPSRHKLAMYYSMSAYIAIVAIIPLLKSIRLSLETDWFIYLFRNTYNYVINYKYSIKLTKNIFYGYTFEFFCFTIFIFIEFPIFLKIINIYLRVNSVWLFNFISVDYCTFLLFFYLLLVKNILFYWWCVVLNFNWSLLIYLLSVISCKATIRSHLLLSLGLLYCYSLKIVDNFRADLFLNNRFSLYWIDFISELWVKHDYLIIFTKNLILLKIDFIYSLLFFLYFFWFGKKLLK